MASGYILFSEKLNRFYTGSFLGLAEWVNEYLQGNYSVSFTNKASDWLTDRDLRSCIDFLDYLTILEVEAFDQKNLGPLNGYLKD